jgi:hypothetical protein
MVNETDPVHTMARLSWLELRMGISMNERANMEERLRILETPATTPDVTERVMARIRSEEARMVFVGAAANLHQSGHHQMADQLMAHFNAMHEELGLLKRVALYSGRALDDLFDPGGASQGRALAGALENWRARYPQGVTSGPVS